MMKFLLFTLFLSVSVPVMAKDISIEIIHPRKNRRVEIVNKIECATTCKWSSKSDKISHGTTDQSNFSKNIESLLELVEAGNVPASKKISQRDQYVDVTITESGKKHSFTLGMPRVYQGKDLEKFNQLNELIIKIEFNLQREKVKK